jgi:hypothetical protein
MSGGTHAAVGQGGLDTGDGTGWNYPSCTMINDEAAVTCMMCQTAKPAATPAGDDNSGDTLLAVLTRARLAEFAEALASEGYEELEDIVGVEFTDSELKNMGMKGGHMKRFRKLTQGAY